MTTRTQMLKEHIIARGVNDKKVIKAMGKINREDFVPPDSRHLAYEDYPLPIGYGQTISQPYMVAFMSAAANLDKGIKVLEIGTGSGYQAAILAEICAELYTVEVVEPLGKNALKTLQNIGYKNIHLRIGDGYDGWQDAAPFDAIIVTAAPAELPQNLVEQLKEGGNMIIPVGEEGHQELLKITKTANGVMTKRLFPVSFVPMVKG
jgi:protein-L-isoaspartate(D-aspartate) O-methyltransferase